jgi:hypothetical protein
MHESFAEAGRMMLMTGLGKPPARISGGIAIGGIGMGGNRSVDV